MCSITVINFVCRYADKQVNSVLSEILEEDGPGKESCMVQRFQEYKAMNLLTRHSKKVSYDNKYFNSGF